LELSIILMGNISYSRVKMHARRGGGFDLQEVST